MKNSLQERLLQAELAYHQLIMGEKAVSVNVAGFGSITYASSDITKLRHYIESLKAEANQVTGKPRRGIIRVEF